MINLRIQNYCAEKLTLKKVVRYSYSDADFPAEIQGFTSVSIDVSSPTGAQGCYAEYQVPGAGNIAIACSNPLVGKNKLGVGTEGKTVWDTMSDHGYKQFTQNFVPAGQSEHYHAICAVSAGAKNTAVVNLFRKEPIFRHGWTESDLIPDTEYKYPVGLLPYLADWLNYVRRGRIGFTYSDPEFIEGVGVLVGVEDNSLIGNQLSTNTCEVVPFRSSDDGHYSWVYTPGGDIIYKWNSRLELDERNYTRHSELGAGRAVLCAGEFNLYDVQHPAHIGALYFEMNDASGHYKPDGGLCLKPVVEKLERLGLDTEFISVRTRG